jgi:hypothetical protein
MTAAKRIGRAWWLSLCLACALSSSASAQSKRDLDDYQRAVKQALHEYDLGNFAEAKAFFTQAHAISPNARTLRGLGMSSYELRTYVEAIGYFEQALTATERALTPQMRAEVAQLLTQARAFVTRVRVTLEPSSATLRLDTRPISTDDQGYVLLDPGTHELVAEAPDRETATRSIRTEGGEQLALTISLHATNVEPKVEAPSEAPQPVFAETAAPKPQEAPESSSIAPWILIGSGAAVNIAGDVMLGVMFSNKHFVEHAPAGSNYQQFRGATQSVFPLSVAGFVTASVGLAAVIAGVTWKLTEGSESQSHENESANESAGAKLEVGPGAVRVSGRF